MHGSPYSVALYPLYGGVLHIIDVVLGLLVGLLVVIVHLCLLYIGMRYSYFSHHCILSHLVLSSRVLSCLEEDCYVSLFFIIKV